MLWFLRQYETVKEIFQTICQIQTKEQCINFFLKYYFSQEEVLSEVQKRQMCDQNSFDTLMLLFPILYRESFDDTFSFTDFQLLSKKVNIIFDLSKKYFNSQEIIQINYFSSNIMNCLSALEILLREQCVESLSKEEFSLLALYLNRSSIHAESLSLLMKQVIEYDHTRKENLFCFLRENLSKLISCNNDFHYDDINNFCRDIVHVPYIENNRASTNSFLQPRFSHDNPFISNRLSDASSSNLDSDSDSDSNSDSDSDTNIQSNISHLQTTQESFNFNEHQEESSSHESTDTPPDDIAFIFNLRFNAQADPLEPYTNSEVFNQAFNHEPGVNSFYRQVKNSESDINFDLRIDDDPSHLAPSVERAQRFMEYLMEQNYIPQTSQQITQTLTSLIN